MTATGFCKGQNEEFRKGNPHKEGSWGHGLGQSTAERLLESHRLLGSCFASCARRLCSGGGTWVPGSLPEPVPWCTRCSVLWSAILPPGPPCLHLGRVPGALRSPGRAVRMCCLGGICPGSRGEKQMGRKNWRKWVGECQDLWGSPSPTPAEAGSPRAGCTALHPGGAGISPEKETPQPPWAAWARALSPSEGRSSFSGSAGASSASVCARCPFVLSLGITEKSLAPSS